MKVNLIHLLLCAVAVAAIVWWFRGSMKDKEWETKLREAPADTVRIVDTVLVKLPPTTGTATVGHWQDGTSQLQRANEILQMSRDSIQMELVRLLEPKQIILQSESLGELVAMIYPVGDTIAWTHYPPLQKVITNTVEVTKTVVIEQGRPWWEIPAAVIVGGLAVFGASQIRK